MSTDQEFVMCEDQTGKHYLVGPARIVDGQQEARVFYNLFAVDGGHVVMESTQLARMYPAVPMDIFDVVFNNDSPMLMQHIDKVADNVLRPHNPGLVRLQ